MESIRKAIYKVRRATILLTLASKTIETLKDGPRKDLMTAMLKAKAENFDFERLENTDVEMLYAHLDSELTQKVIEEFRFIPKRGNIRDLGSQRGVCALCGKGDSKDEHDNKDHLRYEFKLSNTAGGSDVWTGSTCIVHHHLRVDGAASSEEAKGILEKSLREHIAMWKIEMWREEHGDHDDIPEQWRQVMFLPRDLQPYGRYHRFDGEIKLLGFDRGELQRQLSRSYRPFRAAVRFYQRKGFLSAVKTDSWNAVKRVLTAVRIIDRALSDAQDITDADARFQWFANRGEKIQAVVSVKKPRPLDERAA